MPRPTETPHSRLYDYGRETSTAQSRERAEARLQHHPQKRQSGDQCRRLAGRRLPRHEILPGGGCFHGGRVTAEEDNGPNDFFFFEIFSQIFAQ